MTFFEFCATSPSMVAFFPGQTGGDLPYLPSHCRLIIPENHGGFVGTGKVMDARPWGATTEAWEAARRREERSKAAPEMIF